MFALNKKVFPELACEDPPILFSPMLQGKCKVKLLKISPSAETTIKSSTLSEPSQQTKRELMDKAKVFAVPCIQIQPTIFWLNRKATAGMRLGAVQPEVPALLRP